MQAAAFSPCGSTRATTTAALPRARPRDPPGPPRRAGLPVRHVGRRFLAMRYHARDTDAAHLVHRLPGDRVHVEDVRHPVAAHRFGEITASRRSRNAGRSVAAVSSLPGAENDARRAAGLDDTARGHELARA